MFGQFTHANHHGNAARPRQHGDVAGGAAAHQHDGAAGAPVGFKEGGGGNVLANQHGAGGAAGGLATREVAQHAITDVTQVGSAGTEVVIFRGFIACDLAVECCGPCDMRGRSAVDCRKGRRRQRVVLQHGHLKA